MFDCAKARGRERDADAARHAIFAAAELIFARDGYSGARIDAIAAAAGYNKSLLFHYFHGGKRELYQAVVWRSRGEINAQLGELLAPFLTHDGTGSAMPLDASQVRAFIADAVGWAFDYYLGHSNQLRIMMWEAAEGWRTFASWPMPQASVPWLPATLDLIRRAQAAGIIQADLDATILVANVIGMGLIYHASLTRYARMFDNPDLASPAGIARARAQMVTLVLRGTLTPAQEALYADGL